MALSVLPPTPNAEPYLEGEWSLELTRFAEASSSTRGARQTPEYRRVARTIASNPVFVGVTTVLTVYALAGDDVRLMATDRSADLAFNLMLIVCMIIFSTEIVVSCRGKPDYFLGLFCCLDIISTLMLIMDLSWVSDAIAKELSVDGDDTRGSDMRSARTARLGAKAGRAARMFRLIRVLKLHMACHEAARKGHQKEARHLQPGFEDDWDESDLQVQESALLRESSVGRKLSEMTARRVIVLILAMLLVLPFLESEPVDLTARSVSYGADHVSQVFEAYESGHGTREAYEQAMLQFVYYHNWFAGADPEKHCGLGKSSKAAGYSCSDEYFGHLFWVGIMGEDMQLVKNKTSAAALSALVVSAWGNYTTRAKDGIYNYGTMPVQAQALLHSEWDQVCDTASHTRRGISLLREETVSVRCPEDLRTQEIIKFAPRLVTLDRYDSWHFAFYFDLRPYRRTDALYNLLLTLIVLVLLVLVTTLLTHDANNIILRPVEKMVHTVESIRDNPLDAMKMSDDEFKAEEVAKALLRQDGECVKRVLRDLVTCSVCKRSGGELLETVILEKAIIKLGSLLALGFGEAGANIIAQNMRGSESSVVNAMVPGHCVDTVIGVVRVRDFTTATEVLQSKINAFCNQIAEIVHGLCQEFHGAPNRNNGDTFLVIWRLDAEWSPSRTARMAELSIMAFASVLGALHQSPVLADYCSHPVMQNRLGRTGRLSFSFGLHAGWAIEGAVGSEFKIDASYLSPNVSIATSIERLTETYGVVLMVGQSVIELCTSRLVAKCRLIDRVSITGSATPTELYCVDLDCLSVMVDDSAPPQACWNTRQRFKARQYMDTTKNMMLADDFDVMALFCTDPAIFAMRSRYTVEFFECFKMGYQNYSEGEWHVARRMLSRTLSLLDVGDGPSSALLRFMSRYGYVAPRGWEGVRALDADTAWQASPFSSTGSTASSQGPRESAAPHAPIDETASSGTSMWCCSCDTEVAAMFGAGPYRS